MQSSAGMQQSCTCRPRELFPVNMEEADKQEETKVEEEVEEEKEKAEEE